MLVLRPDFFFFWDATIEYPPPPLPLRFPSVRPPPGPQTGGPVPPGAFLLTALVLGDKMTIPAGKKLLSVDGQPTGRLDFQAARAVALSAGPKAVLIFG